MESNSNSNLYMILKEQIQFTKNLGSGAFAEVKKGIWQKSSNETVEVAVKILFESTETVKIDLLNEINLLAKLKHENLIRLYGIVLDPLMMVTEYCDGGSLFDRLKSSKFSIILITEILNYSLQISSGMMYLEKNCYVHRDLATRNILLTKNYEIIKICDFGLSRVVDEKNRLYNMKSRKCVPIAWCAPESLKHRKFSSASDVWSFGVTLWELLTNADDPWKGVAVIDILQALENGERLHKPENAPKNMLNLMDSCWEKYPQQRPSFEEIHEILSKIHYEKIIATKNSYPKSSEYLEIQKGDGLIILEKLENDEIFGQNEMTRFYGKIPKEILENSEILISKIDSPIKPPRKIGKKIEKNLSLNTPPPVPPKPAKYAKINGQLDSDHQRVTIETEKINIPLLEHSQSQSMNVTEEVNEENLSTISNLESNTTKAIPSPQSSTTMPKAEVENKNLSPIKPNVSEHFSGENIKLSPSTKIIPSSPTTPENFQSSPQLTPSRTCSLSSTMIPDVPLSSNQSEISSTTIKSSELTPTSFQITPEKTQPKKYPSSSVTTSEFPIFATDLDQNHSTTATKPKIPSICPVPTINSTTISPTCSHSSNSSLSHFPENSSNVLKSPDAPPQLITKTILQTIPKKSTLFQKQKDNQLKVNLQLAANRLKIIRRKKTELAMKARTEIIALIAAGHPDRARIRVESIIRDDFSSEAYEILELYCELLLKRFGILQEMKILEGLIAEAVISLIWASPRIFTEITEMKIILGQFTERYGKLFVEAAQKNEITLPEEVLPKLIQKMNIIKPSENLVEKYLIQICRYGNIKYIPNKKFITEEEIKALIN